MPRFLCGSLCSLKKFALWILKLLLGVNSTVDGSVPISQLWVCGQAFSRTPLVEVIPAMACCWLFWIGFRPVLPRVSLAFSGELSSLL